MEPAPVPRMVDFAAPPPERTDDQDFGWIDILRIVRRRLGLIVLVTLALTLAALPAIISMEREYIGSTRILLLSPHAGSGARAEDGEDEEVNVEVEIERLVSRETALSLIERFDLISVPEFNPSLRPVPLSQKVKDWITRTITQAPDTEPDPERILDRTVLEVRNSLWAVQQRKTAVVEVGFRSQNQELAGQVPDAIIDIYSKRREQLRQQRIDGAMVWFDERISAQRARVAAAKSARAAFVRRIGPEVFVSEAEEASTFATLTEEGLNLSMERTALGVMLGAPGSISLSLQEDSSGNEEALVKLTSELRYAEVTLETLRETLGNRHERVLEQQARVKELSGALDGMRDIYRTALAEREALVAVQQSKLEERITTERQDVSVLRLARRELALLEKMIEEEEGTLTSLERTQRGLESTRTIQGIEVELLSPASMPLYPTGTGRKSYLGAAMLASAIAALTLAGLVELTDRTVRGSAQLRRIAGITPAGLLPELSELEARSLLRIVRKEPANTFAACIRALVSRLERLEGGRPPDSIVVTSVEEGEGRSTVARSLAIEWATRGVRVLLIDAGPGGRSRSLFPAAANDMGLTDLLRKGQGLDRLVRHDPVTGIDWLPRGTGPLLSDHAQEGIEMLLSQCRAKGIVAIFDAPAMQSVHAPLALAAAADHTLLVLRWGRTRRDHVALAAGMLAEVGVRDIATVIAGVRVRRHALYGFSDRLSLPSARRART